MSKKPFTDLETISPIDGRYRSRVEELHEYFSQHALDRERVKVEVEYLIKLGGLSDVPIDPPAKDLRKIYEEFDLADAKTVQQIEREGYRDIPATNHDVKAIEYYVRERLKDKNLAELIPYVHYALTSEDLNNLAYMKLVKSGADELLDALRRLVESLVELAQANKSQPLLARTHGQPATPSTIGKEFAVFLSRLVSELKKLESSKRSLTGKLAGATGNLSAHADSYPKTDWVEFSKEFVRDYGLKPRETVTQIEPRDNLADLTDNLTRINNILVDLARDCWTYISHDYFTQKREEGEVGSSTMPQKVNPIDFENGEGNLSKANSDLDFLGDYLTKSRLQRDLSDSTVRRNIGTAFAHALIGYKSVIKGLGKLEPNETRLEYDLEDHPEVLAEAWQTSLRKFGHSDAYEVVKEKTRGKRLEPGELDDIIDELPLPENEKARLKKLTPRAYIGKALEITEDAVSEAKSWLESN
jgi:adenylosuccinate lyase